MSNYQAVPTQYKGVVYKSKSEAVFARCLELGGIKHPDQFRIKLEYEPQVLKLSDGYVPDFYLSDWFADESVFRNLIIEYKPSKVTKTYLDKLESRFIQYTTRIREYLTILPKGFNVSVNCGLFCGNVYDDSPKSYFLFHNTLNEWESKQLTWDDFGITSEIIQEARTYRFDLQ